ncbi:MAG: hypothetical protein J7J06_10220 [Methanosarcinales archaeon]|nr:hypothetical protein [Methanosarcinales archaeon]
MTEMDESSGLSDITSRYLKTGNKYLSNANKYFSKNEFRKSSELLWGAVTQSIKALASLSGTHIPSHAKFFDYTRSVSKETGDETYHTLFLELNTLHKNFYDEEIPPVDFPIFYRKAISFLKKTEELMKVQIATRITP